MRIPSGHGDVAAVPPVDQWSAVLERNRSRISSWTCSIGGRPIQEVRSAARAEAVELGRAATDRMASDASEGTGSVATDDPRPLIVTGHQPLLQHPGVWAKVCLASGLAAAVDGLALEAVVDTDGFERIAMVAPGTSLEESRRTVELVTAPLGDAYFASAGAPTADEVDAFEIEGAAILESVDIPGLRDRFARFCRYLRGASNRRDAAEAVTAARRMWERPLSLDYLSLPVTDQVGGRAFAHFASEIAGRAQEFQSVHNECLSAFRRDAGLRSKARPFPDLSAGEHGVELPFWHLDGATRAPVWAQADGDRTRLVARGEVIASLDGPGDGRAIAGIEGSLAPKAITLTLFNRLLVADLFIHGAGGAGYDLITDRVAREFLGLDLPDFAAATMTMRLPIDTPPDTERRVADLQQLLHTIEHNPDRLLRHASDAPEPAAVLVEEKSRLVEEIGRPGADKRILGERIRSVNAALSESLTPMAEATRRDLAEAELARDRAAVLMDRTYPFFLWEPEEIAGYLL